MATNKVEHKTSFAKGHSGTVALKAIFRSSEDGDPMEFDARALIYKWANDSEASGLNSKVKGNDDFSDPEGFDMNYGDAPIIDSETGHFAPDIRSPGDGITEHPLDGVFGKGPAKDLEEMSDVVKHAVAENGGSQGGVKDPSITSEKIAAQTIGYLLDGQSYSDSGN